MYTDGVLAKAVPEQCQWRLEGLRTFTDHFKI
jgi:hypothetical protein